LERLPSKGTPFFSPPPPPQLLFPAPNRCWSLFLFPLFFPRAPTIALTALMASNEDTDGAHAPQPNGPSPPAGCPARPFPVCRDLNLKRNRRPQRRHQRARPAWRCRPSVFPRGQLRQALRSVDDAPNRPVGRPTEDAETEPTRFPQPARPSRFLRLPAEAI